MTAHGGGQPKFGAAGDVTLGGQTFRAACAVMGLDPLDCRDSLGHLTRSQRDALNADWSARMYAASGVDPSQPPPPPCRGDPRGSGRAILDLLRDGGALTPRDLAERLAMSANAAELTLRRLVRLNLVRTIQVPNPRALEHGQRRTMTAYTLATTFDPQ